MLRKASCGSVQVMTEPLRDIGGRVKRLQVRHHRGINAALAPLGLTTVQWDALRKMEEHPHASLRDLGRLTYQTDQAFGALAVRMIKQGLIERVSGPGRAVRHRITEKGHQLRVAADNVVESVLDMSFRSLTPTELAAFDALLTKILPPPPSIPAPEKT